MAIVEAIFARARELQGQEWGGREREWASGSAREVEEERDRVRWLLERSFGGSCRPALFAWSE